MANTLTGNNWPWKCIKCAEDKQQTRPGKEGLKGYAHMTIYAICQARLVLTKLCATTNFLQLLYQEILLAIKFGEMATIFGEFKIWRFAQSNRSYNVIMCTMCTYALQSSRHQIAEDGDVWGWQLCPWSSCIPRDLKPHDRRTASLWP